jgi:hypothetical protein
MHCTAHAAGESLPAATHPNSCNAAASAAILQHVQEWKNTQTIVLTHTKQLLLWLHQLQL